jgi:hypothetical protein
MKRLLTVLLVGSLLLAVSAASLGALHNTNSDFRNYAGDGGWENFYPPSMEWYYISAETPYWLLLGTIEPDSSGRLDGLYYLNDQTYAELGHNTDGYPLYLKGSYKFNNNVFVGFAYDTYYDPAMTAVGIGYVFEWGENGYIAISADFRHYFEKARIFGQIYSEEGSDLIIDFGIAYQITETFVLGGSIHSLDENSNYSLGFTWKPTFMILDASYTDFMDYDYNLVELSGMFQANDNLLLGLGYQKWSDDSDAGIYAKARYSFDSCDFWAQYRLGNDSYDSQFMIGLKKNL